MTTFATAHVSIAFSRPDARISFPLTQLAEIISFYASDSDLVRITGYLVKRSEMEKYYKGEAVLQNTVYLGGDNYRNAHLENRKVRAL